MQRVNGAGTHHMSCGGGLLSVVALQPIGDGEVIVVVGGVIGLMVD